MTGSQAEGTPYLCASAGLRWWRDCVTSSILGTDVKDKELASAVVPLVKLLAWGFMATYSYADIGLYGGEATMSLFNNISELVDCTVCNRSSWWTSPPTTTHVGVEQLSNHSNI